MAVLFEFLRAQLMIIAASKYSIDRMFRRNDGADNTREDIRMPDSPYKVHAPPHGRHDSKGNSRGGWFFGVDPIYGWSALAGLVVAAFLIGLAVLMRSHALH